MDALSIDAFNILCALFGFYSMCRTLLAVLINVVHEFPGTQGRKRALIIGIAYDTNGKQSDDLFSPLRHTHNDAFQMQELLTRKYRFKPQEIVFMIDRPDTTDEMQPTYKNLTFQINKLGSDVRPRDSVVLYFAGHGTQRQAVKDKCEEDGMDEALMPVDHNGEQNVILDDFIYESVVQRFPPGAKLTIVLDCCHSHTMADLVHYRCNKHYSHCAKIIIICRVYIRFTRGAHKGHKPSAFASILRYARRWSKLCRSPSTMEKANGHCRRSGCCKPNLTPMYDVTCISACRDQDIVYEVDKNVRTKGMDSATFTQALVRIMCSENRLSWNRLMSRFYEETGKIWDHIHQQYFHPLHPSSPNTALPTVHPGSSCHKKIYAWRPQLSSQQPLNMDDPVSFVYCRRTFRIHALVYIHFLWLLFLLKSCYPTRRILTLGWTVYGAIVAPVWWRNDPLSML